MNDYSPETSGPFMLWKGEQMALGQTRQQLDPNGLFLNDFFTTMFAKYLCNTQVNGQGGQECVWSEGLVDRLPTT